MVGEGEVLGGVQTDFVLAPCSPPPTYYRFSLSNWLQAAGLKDNSTLVLLTLVWIIVPAPLPEGFAF